MKLTGPQSVATPREVTTRSERARDCCSPCNDLGLLVYPRVDIKALKAVTAPHKRCRRTNAEVAVVKAVKEQRKAARATRAPAD